MSIIDPDRMRRLEQKVQELQGRTIATFNGTSTPPDPPPDDSARESALDKTREDAVSAINGSLTSKATDLRAILLVALYGFDVIRARGGR